MSGIKSIFLVASLMAMGALSIDTILPALSIIKSQYNVNPRHIHWTITIVFLGLSVGQLVFGPISDSIGRKKTSLLGLGIFGLGNIISISANDYGLFLISRFFQGLGAGATVVVSRAIARDLYSGSQLARVMSFVTTIFILVPVVAPGIGQLVISQLSWEFIPILTVIFCLALALWIIAFQFETIKKLRPFNFRLILDGVGEVFKCKVSRSYTITAGLTFGVLVSYLNISQPLFQEYLLVGKYFVIYFGVLALAVGLGSFLNAKLVTKLNPKTIILFSLKFETIWAISFLLFFNIGGVFNTFTVMLFLLPNFFVFGTIFGNMTALALSPMGHIAGTASAIIGTSTTLIALPLASLIGFYFSGTLLPFIFLIITVSTLSLLMIKKLI